MSSTVLKKKSTNSIPAYQGDWGKKQKMHLLRRTQIGVGTKDFKALKDLSLDQAVFRQISEAPIPDPPIHDYEGDTNNPDPDVAIGQTWVTAKYFENNNEARRRDSLKGWWIKNAIEHENIHEKMVLFLHSLLVVDRDAYTKVQFQYFDLLRKYALGNYKVLMKELTINPAMLRYLNGNSNTVKAPDENYGRELQELFTVGKGINSKYTEEDVREAARVLTGWKTYYNKLLEAGIPQSEFLANSHDTGDKQFSDFYGNTIITGKSGASAGEEELDDLLDMIFDNNETALYVCRRLYTFFVYTEIDAATEVEVIAPLAQLFRESDYELKPVIEALFKSEHFYKESNMGALVKSPMEFVIGLWRGLEVKYTAPDDIGNLYYTNKVLKSNMLNMGMDPGDPPSVAGWPVYYQAPLYDKSWITTDSITVRAAFSDLLIDKGLWVKNKNTGEVVRVKANLIELLKGLDNSPDANLMIDEVNELLMGLKISDEEKTYLKKQVLLGGQETDSYWSESWYNHINNPGDEVAKGEVESRLKDLFKALLQLGEVHLM
ncbi:MAG: hypothetical protein ACJA2S_000607 [Cyclobacteriaceae bacterium]|jgi:uncharacterized protein (DUF1800 family)